jgi:hypothetical protein
LFNVSVLVDYFFVGRGRVVVVVYLLPRKQKEKKVVEEEEEDVIILIVTEEKGEEDVGVEDIKISKLLSFRQFFEFAWHQISLLVGIIHLHGRNLESQT